MYNVNIRDALEFTGINTHDDAIVKLKIERENRIYSVDWLDFTEKVNTYNIYVFHVVLIDSCLVYELLYQDDLRDILVRYDIK